MILRKTMPRLLLVATIARTFHFLLPLVHHFRERGWQVDALTSAVSGFPKVNEYANNVWEIDWTRNPLDPSLFSKPRKIAQIVEQQHYDIVHTHTPVASFITRYALRRVRQTGLCKVIYTAHGFHYQSSQTSLKNQALLELEKIAGNWTDYLVIINHEDKQVAQKHHIVPKDRIIYIPGIGVDLDYYSAQAINQSEVAEVRRQLNLQPDSRVFLMMAEFTANKRQKDVVRAFQQVTDENAHLAFAGDGPLLEETKKLAADLGVESRVHFLGFCPDIRPYVLAADALILPSKREGLPRSIMEAMALEIPVIGTDIRGTRELLADQAGLIVDVGDIAGLAQAMGWILENPEEALEMGKRGRQRMSQYSQERIIELHEKLYQQALLTT
jgi:glycosyltransferase involved in cell wall biosynthesis